VYGKNKYMRKRIIAGNWKMNLSIEEGISLTKEIIQEIRNKQINTNVIICPAHTHLYSIEEVTKNSPIGLCAQNCSSNDNGAYTGEISAKMVSDIGASHIIIGHSERRTYFNETNKLIKKKIHQVLKYGLTPIFCCGENLDQRNNDKHFNIVKEQIEIGLFELNEAELKKVIIAYEPVWAIGTGETATPEQAQEMHAYIRDIITSKYSCAKDISILYGGSCKPENAEDIFKQNDVDGGLIGGASLKASDFLKLIYQRELF
jgi:triosephosphate isomerase